MPRSEASIARRAAKRNRTVEEQRNIDQERDRGYKGKQWDSTLATTKRSRPPPLPADTEVKASSSSSKKQKTSSDSVAATTGAEMEEEVREMWTCAKCKHNENWTTRYKCRECQAPRYDRAERKKRDQSWIDPAVANNWKAPATADKLLQNAALRAQYEKCPEAMDEDDRNRARVLVERSMRKKKKKLARRQAHANRLQGKSPTK